MAGGIDWFRWHHGSATDPKFRLVAKRAGARVSEVLAVWACLLEAASAAEDRGNVGRPDFEAMDLALDMDDGTAARIYARMCERDVIDADSGRVVSWEKRQPKRERPEDVTAAERKRNQRAKEKGDAAAVTPTGAIESHVTPCHATEGQVTPRGEERREEKSELPPVSPQGGKRPAAVGLKVWLDAVKAAGESPVGEDDPVFAYAAEVGIPTDFLRLAWLEFKHRYMQPDAKRYRDWRSVFRKAVRGNWLKLWFFDPACGQYGLTTVGMQAQRAHAERKSA